MATILRPQARERWLLPQVGAITPQYIEMTLRGALAGAHIPQWELFNLMEDTWPRLRKNILELKMAVRNRRPVLEAYRDEDSEESPAATERMKLVSAALRKMQPDPTADEGGFDDMLFDILDAWFKGISVLEIDWHVTQTHSLGRFIAPRCTRWANPIHYAWDTDLRLSLAECETSNSECGMRNSESRSARASSFRTPHSDFRNPLSAFPPDRFLVAKCKTKSGSILGGALLRPLVWWWCAANFSADWLLNLAQIFGLPFRWATYEPTAAQETVDRICSMLQNMGSAGWAAFPAGTSLELKADGQKSGAQTPQGDMLDRADKQCDLLVLGQTLTTDTGGMGSGGGSHALGRVHADVRSGIIDAAAKFTAGILEQQLIPAILRLNYGDCEEAPTLQLQAITEDNLREKAAILAQLHAAGAGSIIPLDWLGKTFGIPKPKDGEATLAGAAAANSELPPLPKAPFEAANNWNPLLHLRDTIGRFTHMAGGSAGPTGTPAAASTDISKAHIDPAVKELSVAKALHHYVVSINGLTKFYDANAKFFEQHKFGTDGEGVARYYNEKDSKHPLTTVVPPRVLQKLKLIYLDDGKGNNLGECVSLVKNLAGLGHTSTWHPGAKVIDVNDLKPGTAIGTFNKDGHFVGHAAIFLFRRKNEKGKDCIYVLDQYTPKDSGKHLQIRPLEIIPEPKSPTPYQIVNKANFFYVIETDPAR